MNYKVLYRKYRPSNFNEMVGQKKTIELLKESIINDKLAHAYIFSGPRGTGKTSTAKILAKTVNCLNPVDGNPCGECENCVNFATSSDIYEIDAASNNGVDQIREIIENIKLAPISSKYKVYIIDEVHMLSTSAFNALLLTLEEPPAHVLFILATTDIEDVPITVLSRCQRLEFKKITCEDIEGNLRKISDLENIDISDEAIHEIAMYSDGGMRDALSVLDQLSKENYRIEEDTVLANIGLISTQNVIKLLDYIENGDNNEIVEFVEECTKNAYDIKTLIKKIIIEIKNREVNIKNDKFITNLSYSLYKKLAFDLSDLLWKNSINIDTYILLELLLLEYAGKPQELRENPVDHTPDIFQKKEEKSVDNLLKNSEEKVEKKSEIIEEIFEKNIEEKVEEKNVEKQENISVSTSYYQRLAEVRLNNCCTAPVKSLKDQNVPIWKNYVLHETSRKIKGMLSDTNIGMNSKDIIILCHPYEDGAKTFNENVELIEKNFNEFNSSNYKLACITEETMLEIKNSYKDNKDKYKIMPEPSKDEEVELNDVFSHAKIECK